MKHTKIKIPHVLIKVDPKLLRKYTERVSEGAPAYLTGVIDYTLAEILELSGNTATSNVITPSIIRSAIRNDGDLYNLLRKHM